MERTQVKIKKLTPQAKLPTYGTLGSAGADLYACLGADITIAPGDTAFIPTGLAVQIPDGFVGLVYARSGLASKQGLAPANKVGVIDSDYRGEITVSLLNHGKEPRTVHSGDRVAQLVIAPYIAADFTLCDELDDTARGEGGFGSTGTK